jgi:cell division protein FtsL
MRKARAIPICLATVVVLTACFSLISERHPGRQAVAAEKRSFCEVTDADDLLSRLGQRLSVGSVELVASKAVARPGERMLARLANKSQHLAFFGAEFKIQRYTQEGWKTNPSSPAGPWPRRSGKLKPGQAAACYAFTIPPQQEPGRYRFVTTVQLKGASRKVASEFSVPASAELPAFCRGEKVPEDFAGRVALVAKSPVVLRGGYLCVRVFNGSSRPAGVGHRYWQQRYLDGAWQTIPPAPPPDGTNPAYPPASRLRLRATSAGPCVRLQMEADQPPGRYRLITTVYLNLRSGADPQFRIAEFRVR